MTRLLPLLLLLTACASSAPTTYSQGMPVAPPVTTAPNFTTPGATPVGRGGPMVGQPGYVGPVEDLPRSPYGRVLPQTPDTRKEPGVWAAEQPTATRRRMDFNLMEFSLPRPPPEGHPTSVEEVEPVEHCAVSMTILINGDHIRSVAYLNLQRDKKCVVAQLYEACARELLKRHEERTSEDGSTDHDDKVRRRLDAMRQTARDYVNQSCRNVDSEDATSEFIAEVVAAWGRTGAPARRF